MHADMMGKIQQAIEDMDLLLHYAIRLVFALGIAALGVAFMAIIVGFVVTLITGS